MNKTLVNFCKIEKLALTYYAKRSSFASKRDIFDILAKRFPKQQDLLIFIALDAAAEAFNFHNETGPWKRDLLKLAGHFSDSDLKLARILCK